MELLFILGISVKLYAHRLVFGRLAEFVFIGLPLAQYVGKILDKANKSSFDPVKYIYGVPQISLPEDGVIEVKVSKDEGSDEVETEPDEKPDDEKKTTTYNISVAFKPDDELSAQSGQDAAQGSKTQLEEPDEDERW